MLDSEQVKKLENISSRINKVYNGIECQEYKTSCLNSVRQCLEYLCLFTCEVYEIKITRKTKKGDIVENDNPTLGDMAPIIEKHFKENNIIWSKEVGMHIGSIWIVGNLGSHAQKEHLESEEDISNATIENALNSMYIVTKWFYDHYKQDCPIELRQNDTISVKDKEIAEKQNLLYEKIATIKRKLDERILDGVEKTEVDEPAFEDIYFEDLLEAVELGQCVLFIGPDLAIDEQGENLHEKFYKSISRRNIEYNEKDGFFMPKAEKQIELKALNYYGKKFPAENQLGFEVLRKLAEIPFSLIISVTPDDSMRKIFEMYNKKHEFIYYNPRLKLDVGEPTIQNPVLFNMLGNTSIDGKYVFTHKQFYEYVNQKQDVKLPFEIETKIKDVAHYLFIVIDFDKWYNRLLLFALNLYEEAEAYGFDNHIPEDIHIDFMSKQFNISFINDNYKEFVEVLHAKCKEQELTKQLEETFVESTTEEISGISDADLEIVESLIENLDQKIAVIENQLAD